MNMLSIKWSGYTQKELQSKTKIIDCFSYFQSLESDKLREFWVVQWALYAHKLQFLRAVWLFAS
jgi:hypothetical protein